MSVVSEIYGQFFHKPPVPTTSFTGKTIIITGANIGLGLEASKHFVRLGAQKVIIAVRSLSKGTAAKAEIDTTTKRTGVVKVWELNYAKYDSVKAFAARVATLARIDAVILNAGISTQEWEVFEGNESTITVNVISTTLLMFLLLPTLRASAEKWNIEPVLTVVGSGVHAYTSFPEGKFLNILEALNDEKTARMNDRYVYHFHHRPAHHPLSLTPFPTATSSPNSSNSSLSALSPPAPPHPPPSSSSAASTLASAKQRLRAA